MGQEMRTVSTLGARDIVAECPHCNEKVDGFLIDPRGLVVDCDFCEKKFKIHKEADVEIDI